MLQSVTKQISISELHELDDTDYETITITTVRRNEPGAGDFKGIVFTNERTSVSTFETPEKALSFIDDVQQHGLIKAVGNQLNEEHPSREIVIQKLHGPTEKVNTDEYIENAGIENPLNLRITPSINTTKQITETNHPTPPTENIERAQ